MKGTTNKQATPNITSANKKQYFNFSYPPIGNSMPKIMVIKKSCLRTRIDGSLKVL